MRQQGNAKRSEYYPLSAANQLTLQDGDKLIVTSDRYAGTIQVRIEGAHSGEHAVVLPYGATEASSSSVTHQHHVADECYPALSSIRRQSPA